MLAAKDLMMGISRLEARMLAAVVGCGFVALAENGLAAQETIRYELDAGKSQFSVMAYSTGLLKTFGHDHVIAIRDFTGETHLAPDSDLPVSVTIVIRAGSLTVTDKNVSESDRRKIEGDMHGKVLETNLYPQIVFRSTRIMGQKTTKGAAHLQITGDLTLHGVTRPIHFEAEAERHGNQVRTSGAFSIRQTDHKIKTISVAGGSVRVKDELSCHFEVLARH